MTKDNEMPLKMSNLEAIGMMNRCKQEILTLQTEIARLAAKADAYDNLASVLRLLPQPNAAGYGEDFIWVLDERIRELTPKSEAEA